MTRVQRHLACGLATAVLAVVADHGRGLAPPHSAARRGHLPARGPRSSDPTGFVLVGAQAGRLLDVQRQGGSLRIAALSPGFGAGGLLCRLVSLLGEPGRCC
jgi:hypothetical protein